MTKSPGLPDAPPPGNDHDPADRDPEDTHPTLFRERTELAWDRTGIAFAALGGAVLKTAPAVGFCILATSLLIFVLGRTSRLDPRATGSARQRSLLVITVAVTAVSLAALTLTFRAGLHHHVTVRTGCGIRCMITTVR